MGKAFGPFARLTLSYDFVAIALLHMAVNQPDIEYRSFHCAANPLKKRTLCLCPESLDFAAACAISTLYYKLKDDIQDERGFKRIARWLMLPLARIGRKKAEKSYPELVRIAQEIMTRQNSVESRPDAGIDLSADPSASALGQICSLMSEHPEKKTVLYDFGYMLGRWVYLIDAADDLEEDLKRKRFNPYLHLAEKSADEQKALIESTLNLCMTEVARRFEKLGFEKHQSILQNIVYLGLATQQRMVLNPIKKKDCTPQAVE